MFYRQYTGHAYRCEQASTTSRRFYTSSERKYNFILRVQRPTFDGGIFILNMALANPTGKLLGMSAFYSLE